MASLETKLELDMTDLDVALEKAERLKASLEAIKELQADIASWPAPEQHEQFAQDVERQIDADARPSRRSKL